MRRIYDAPMPDDGTRVLVDRLWPRGVSKVRAHLDEATQQTLTLLTATKHPEISEAAVLAELLTQGTPG